MRFEINSKSKIAIPDFLTKFPQRKFPEDWLHLF